MTMRKGWREIRGWGRREKESKLDRRRENQKKLQQDLLQQDEEQ